MNSTYRGRQSGVQSDVSCHQSRDKRRCFRQNVHEYSYVNEFSNSVIDIPGISKEKLEKFVFGLNPLIHLEILMSGTWNVYNVTRMALNVDIALYGAGIVRQ